MARLHLFTLLLALALPIQANANPTMKFTCPIPESLPQWQQLVDLYTSAFASLGYDFSMTYYNATRERTIQRTSDAYDGTCVGSKKIASKKFDDQMILINSPVGDPTTSVWVLSENETPPLKNARPEDGTKIGYLRGNLIASAVLRDYPDIDNVSFLRPDLGFKTLAAGRIDYWIGFTATATFLNEHYNFGNRIEMQEILRQDYMYGHLKKKHAKLVPELEHAISALTNKRGTLIR